jgi:predicted  nucleic acid-binding Zn-ribbon protein
VFPIHQEGIEMVRSSEGLIEVAGEWECMECGYIEEGIEGRRPKKCPECGASASALEFFPDGDDADFDRVVGDEYDEDDTDEDEDEEYQEEESESAFP